MRKMNKNEPFADPLGKPFGFPHPCLFLKAAAAADELSPGLRESRLQICSIRLQACDPATGQLVHRLLKPPTQDISI